MPSKLQGKGWPEHTLNLPTGNVVPDPSGKLDDAGNPRLIDETTQVIVRLRATNNGQIRQLVGADQNTLALEGQCLNPVRLPPGLQPGAEAALTIDGTPGTLTILPWIASQHEKVIAKIGQKFAARWEATT